MRGWFTLDLLSSFPLSYLLLFARLIQGDFRGDRGGYQRLLRLSKIARVKRLKIVLKKWEESGHIGDMAAYWGSVGTLFVVIVSGHFTTCLWFWAGSRHGNIKCKPGN